MLPACLLFATVAVAQEEWRQEGDGRSDDRVSDSRLTDGLSVQAAASSQPEVKPDQQKNLAEEVRCLLRHCRFPVPLWARA
jgi:hypothetical protein